MSEYSFLFLLLLTTATDSIAADGLRGDKLDQQFQALLTAKCVICHDDRGTGAGSGVDNLLKLDELSDGYVDADAPEDSYLLDVMVGESATMPKERMKDFKWSGALTAEEQQLVTEWTLRGGPSEEYLAASAGTERPQITHDMIDRAILADLSTLSGTDLRMARFLTISNLYNNSTVSDSDLDVYRAAIVKTLNSLSYNTDVLGLDTSSAYNKLVAVDEQRTIFRFDLRHIDWTDGTWERVARHYPFAIEQRSGARSITTMTSSSLPHMRADWFVFATLQPPLYHDLARIPNSLEALDESLGIDRARAARERRLVRAGMELSKVSVNNRLLERIPMTTRAGAYHISYDFASNNGKQNFFNNPLGPEGTFDTEFSFEHDGGEVVFNLPNGFQGYALVEADGSRLDTAPQAIVQDGTMPGSTIINGISCLSCHFQGVKPEAGSPRLDLLDEVLENVMDDRRRFSTDDRELIAELYPPAGKFKSLLELDRKRFLAALKAAGIEQKGSVEPARAIFDRFVADIDLETMAAEFGRTPEELEQAMDRDSDTRQILRRIKRGSMKRQLYTGEYSNIVPLLGDGDVRRFEKLPSPYFGEAVSSAEGEASSEPTAARALATTFGSTYGQRISAGQTGIDLLDAEHRTGKLQVTIQTADEKRSFHEGEVIATRVRATQDCFLTIVSVDASGDVTLLLPNQSHPEFRLKRGRTVTIPTKEMGFEFFATAPHGHTLLKAIATTRPLRLKGITPAKIRSTALLSLGNTKGIGVRRSVPSTSVSATSQTQVQFTEQTLDRTFSPNEWATSTFTLATRK